ncbi:MAG: hypothetical protein ACRD28_08380 [Acidobacteriaceae bacterium]
MNEIYKARLSLIPILAEKHEGRYIGRTALMKYMYFLQTLRGVPLGYHFSMYSYGPFDSEVLSDLSSAEAMNIVSSMPVSFSGGYGYRIQASRNAQAAKQESGKFISQHENDVEWLFSKFGGMTSAELELASTIIYVDREFYGERKRFEPEQIVARVREIKPHFSQEQVQKSFDSLFDKGLITSTQTGTS